MKRVQIKVTIDKKGKVEMEGINFAGKDCDKAMQVLVDALGVETDRTNKPEYYNNYGSETVTTKN